MTTRGRSNSVDRKTTRFVRWWAGEIGLAFFIGVAFLGVDARGLK
jgi:hypothetical protein